MSLHTHFTKSGLEELSHAIGVADADLIVADSNEVTCRQSKGARVSQSLWRQKKLYTT
jgi:hypothetical protein